MAGRLVAVTSQTPGIMGLNLQTELEASGPLWARKAHNCIVDGSGRLAARKGWVKQHTTAITNTPEVTQLFEYLPGNNTNEMVFAADNKLWKDETSPIDITGSISITADNWKFQNFNGDVIGFQKDHEPIIWNGSGDFEYLVDQNDVWVMSTAYALGDVVVPTTRNGYWYECTTAGTSSGVEPTWDTTPDSGTTSDGTAVWTTRQIPKGNEALSAFGRMWVVDTDKTSVWYSDLLVPYNNSNAGSGSGGSISLLSVWTRGVDSITALAAFNNNLIMLGKDSITVYAGADDVTASTFGLSDSILGTGCIARDTVQAIDEDLFYLSRDGIRSMKRDLIRSKMPLNTVTHKVRDDIVSKISVDNVDNIRSVYNENESFYLILFPASAQIYSLDIRRYMSEGHVSIYTWSDMGARSFATRENGELLLGSYDGFVGKYTGFSDNEEQYEMSFRSSWIEPQTSYGEPALAGRQVILKKMQGVINSIANIQPSLTWSVDYRQSIEDSRIIQFVASNVSEWGLAKYGINEYGGGITSHEFTVNTSGQGKVFSFGLDAPVAAAQIILYYMTNYFTLGRTG